MFACFLVLPKFIHVPSYLPVFPHVLQCSFYSPTSLTFYFNMFSNVPLSSYSVSCSILSPHSTTFPYILVFPCVTMSHNTAMFPQVIILSCIPSWFSVFSHSYIPLCFHMFLQLHQIQSCFSLFPHLLHSLVTYVFLYRYASPITLPYPMFPYVPHVFVHILPCPFMLSHFS